MSSQQFLIDAASRHAVFVVRYSNGRQRDISREITTMLDVVAGMNDAGRTRREISNYITEFFSEFNEDVLRQIQDFAEQELEFSFRMLDESTEGAGINSGSLDVSRSRVEFTEGQAVTIQSVLNTLASNKRKQIIQTIRDGNSAGLTEQQQSRAIRGMARLTASQAGAVIRTTNNAISTEARMRTIEANQDVVTGYRWVSTLDSRTSFICMSRDGNKYKYNSDDPVPPAHWNCRSTIIPIIDPKFDAGADIEGDRPSIGGDGVELVGAKTTYGGWLRRQPASFQDEALGPTRAALFRRGKLSIDQFVNDDGQTLTLNELRNLHPLAFEQANLD